MSDNIRYDNIICDAISIIANKKIGEAPFDKTIRAVIKGKAEGDGLGYIVLGEGTSQFTAYVTSPDITYEKDDVVYVLVPGNDMTRRKTIICSANDQQTNYKDITYTTYNTNGPNVISPVKETTTTYLLNSYKDGGDEKVLYEYGVENNLLQVDNEAAAEFIKESGDIFLAVDVLMNDKWDVTQVGGSYNAVFSLAFKDPSTGQEVIRDFQVGTLDVRQKHPDSLTEKTTISEIVQDADTANFDHIERISIYVVDYPSNETKGQKEYSTYLDLEFSNFYLQGVDVNTETKSNAYEVHLDISENKNGRTVNESDDVIITAQVKQAGILINPNSNTLTKEYYWFIQDNLVVRGHEAFHNEAGRGWRCLNPKQGGKFVPLGETFIITTKQIPEGQNNYYNIQTATANFKCVVHYGKEWLHDEIKINSKAPTFELYISSSDTLDDGKTPQTIYYLNHGSPDLTCNVTYNKPADSNLNITQEDYIYNWTVTSNNGKVVKTQEQQNENYISNKNIIDNLIFKINETVKNIDNEQEKQVYLTITESLKLINLETGEEKDLGQTYQQWLDYAKTNYSTSNYVQGKTWYNVPIRDITNKSTYTCTVQYKTTQTVDDKDVTYYHPVGTASIVIYNKRQLEGEQNLIINNGTQVFQYDSKGLSPAAAALQKPQKIQPLTFVWLDSAGNQVAIGSLDSYSWYVPVNDTLIKCIVTEQTPKDESGEYYIFRNQAFLPYAIEDNYDPKKKNNTIKLHAVLKDNELDAYTFLTFAKDGNPGTNGTQYVTKIVPVNSSSERLYFYMAPDDTSNQGRSMLYDDTGVEVTKLKFKLYSGGQALDDTEINVDGTTVIWEVLKNNENDFTFIKVTSDEQNHSEAAISVETGADLSKLNMETAPYDIIRASVKYNGFNHIAEFPIHVVNIGSQNDKSFYRMKIKPLTGFKYAVYASDGRTPDYDNTLPFEIQVERLISNGNAKYWEHIENYGNIKYMYNCTPYLSMRSWNYQTGEEEDVLYDKESYKFTNKVIIIPSDTFDGESLNESFTVAAKIDLGDNAKKILYMNVPIYLMLNRYGNAALNDWDGNSIDIDGDDGHILAPQFGAGEKDNKNLFTGVLMGAFKKPEKQDEQGNKIDAQDDVGIMAFDKGQRTVFIDSRTGKSEFGKKNAAQIIIDPSTNKAQLYSGNYKKATGTENGAGMLIDLTTPEIRFGSENFMVNENGQITAKGGGNIAGWDIHDDMLTSPSTKTNNGITYTPLTLGINQIVYKDSDANDLFKVTNAGNATIAGWNFDFSKFYKGKVGINSIANTASAGASTVTVKNIDTDKDETKAIAFYAGDNLFYVTHDGYLKSQKGNIGGWEITLNQLKSPNGKMILKPGSISIGTGFSATDGEAKIGGWIVNSNSIQSDGKKDNSQDPITVLNKNGSIVTDSLEANKGSIGGITIGNNVLHGTGFYLGPNGCHFTGLTVTNNGVGIGTVSNGGSGSYSNGGSGSTVARFGGSGSYVSPSMRTGRNDTQTWEDYIDATIKVKRLQGGAVRTGNFSVLEGYNAATDTGSGAAIFTVSGNTVSFSPNCQILVSNKQGLTTQVDIGGLKLTFTRGILTNKTGSYTPPTNTGSTGG